MQLFWDDICEHSPGNMLRCAQGYYTPGYRFQQHYHDFAEFFLITEGEGYHYCDGHRSPLRASSCCFIHPDCEHSLTASEESSMSIINVAIAPQLWTHIHDLYFDTAQDWFWSRSKGCSVHHVPEQARRSFMDAVTELEQDHSSRLAEDALLLHFINTFTTTTTQTNSNKAPQWLQELLLTMNEPKYFQDSMEAMVRLSEKSREHINRSIRTYYQQTATEYMNGLRMRYSCRRLLESTDSIMKIALDCGFESQAHFFRLFKKTHHCTPRQFRMTRKVL